MRQPASSCDAAGQMQPPPGRMLAAASATKEVAAPTLPPTARSYSFQPIDASQKIITGGGREAGEGLPLLQLLLLLLQRLLLRKLGFVIRVGRQLQSWGGGPTTTHPPASRIKLRPSSAPWRVIACGSQLAPWRPGSCLLRSASSRPRNGC